MKKWIPVLTAIVLIIVIVTISFGLKLMDKYAYSDDKADLNEYFTIEKENEVAIILQDQQMESSAFMFDDVCYFDMQTVQTYFNHRFYEDKNENLLIYTLPDDSIKNEIGTDKVSSSKGENTEPYMISRYEGETLYIAVEYVKKFTNFSYEIFTDPSRMQVYTQWDERQIAQINKDTAVRHKGGVKSSILTELVAQDTVIILEEMETWSKVKTADGFIGYVENKRLKDKQTQSPIPVTDYVQPEYTSISKPYKINLAWHVVAGTAGNDTLIGALEGTKGINTISPTWFALSDNEGGFSNFATEAYVSTAHDRGIEVWPLLDNFTNKGDISTYEILSYTSKRERLIKNLVDTVIAYDLDGINIDFEEVSVDAGEHYVQFLRELSIPCRANGIVLSVDNYVPTGGTKHYNRKEQGVVADYVVIMGYDEHYRGSDEAGSVASIGFVERGIEMTLEDVPAEKIINAVPFYTRIWEITGSELGSQAVGMEMAEKFTVDHGMEVVWDEETCQNYGEKQEGDTLYQVWLEDESSIKVKLNIMDKHGIAGVAAWKLGFEKNAIWDVIAEYVNK